MVKLSDVAAAAGVSPAAVSRVLSGDVTVRVSDETRRRVTDAARELGYVPNHAARSLRTARTSTIALVVPDVTSAVFAELARGAEREADSRGLSIVLGRAESVIPGGDWLRRMVGEGRIDGVILQPPDGIPPLDLLGLAAVGTPVVVINSIADGPVDTVVLDDAAGITQAVAHLLSRGHQQVGFIGGLTGSAPSARREAAFRQSMAAAGTEVREGWMTSEGYSGTDGRTAIGELIARGPLPTALVVANLNAALGVLAEIHSRGLRVPDDVSIVAMHDVWYADATWPPMTTVRMPLAQLGAAAVGLVTDPAAPGGAARHLTVDAPSPELVIRASTRSVGPPSS